MASFTRAFAVFAVLAIFLLAPSSAGNFYQDVGLNWGGPRAQIQNGGQLLTLNLDYDSGSGFESYSPYLYGRFDVQMKLVPGNSAGTVTTFYLSSLGEGHDEIDFEFLGNSSGQPCTIHTNVFAKGEGNREQQFVPWFNTTEFHTYTILWNPQRIIFMIDNTAIRVFNNHGANQIPFPTSQAMKVYGSLWEADEWATEGGRKKIDWTSAPFTATYQNYNADACALTASGNSCSANGNSSQAWQTQGLDDNARIEMQRIQEKYMIYNYCTDVARHPQGFPAECSLPMY